MTLSDPAPSSPAFVPPAWLRGGHAQTILGRYWPGPPARLPGRDRAIDLPDGDRLVVADDIPPRWQPGDPVVLLVHGLGSDANAPYVVRVADRLHRRGIRTARMNLRGAGAGFGLARGIYHGGRTEDLRAAGGWILGESPGSALALVGFSLGANLVLKLAAEAASDPIEGLEFVVACNPPLDLRACAGHIRRAARGFYDRNFVRHLVAEVGRLHARFPDLGPPSLDGIASVYDFDDRYTAPRNGFRDAEDYYARSGAGPLLMQVGIPGLVIHAADDPFIPVDAVTRWAFPAHLPLELSAHGGHLGYLSRRPWRGTRRWLDARIEHALLGHWGINPARSPRDHRSQQGSATPSPPAGSPRSAPPPRAIDQS